MINRIIHRDYRNRSASISFTFYQRGWVESWGTGTTRMIGYCQENGTPEPEFEEYSGGFAVIFRFKEAMGGGQRIKNVEKPTLHKRQEKIMKILSGLY